MGGLKMNIIALEASMGFKWEQGLHKAINKANHLPDLTSMLQEVEKIKQLFVGSTLAQLRNSFEFGNEVNKLIARYGPKLWPPSGTDRSAWLYNAAVLSRPEIYPEDLYYGEDKPFLKQQFLKWVTHKVLRYNENFPKELHNRFGSQEYVPDRSAGDSIQAGYCSSTASVSPSETSRVNTMTPGTSDDHRFTIPSSAEMALINATSSSFRSAGENQHEAKINRHETSYSNFETTNGNDASEDPDEIIVARPRQQIATRFDSKSPSLGSLTEYPPSFISQRASHTPNFCKKRPTAQDFDGESLPRKRKISGKSGSLPETMATRASTSVAVEQAGSRRPPTPGLHCGSRKDNSCKKKKRMTSSIFIMPDAQDHSHLRENFASSSMPQEEVLPQINLSHSRRISGTGWFTRSEDDRRPTAPPFGGFGQHLRGDSSHNTGQANQVASMEDLRSCPNNADIRRTVDMEQKEPLMAEKRSAELDREYRTRGKAPHTPYVEDATADNNDLNSNGDYSEILHFHAMGQYRKPTVPVENRQSSINNERARLATTTSGSKQGNALDMAPSAVYWAAESDFPAYIPLRQCRTSQEFFRSIRNHLPPELQDEEIIGVSVKLQNAQECCIQRKINCRLGENFGEDGFYNMTEVLRDSLTKVRPELKIVVEFRNKHIVSKLLEAS